MQSALLKSRELWAGLLYGALGVTGLLLASAYGFGSTTRMGSGFFPMILSGLLIALGLVSIGRAILLTRNDPATQISGIALKPVLLVVASVVAFAWLLPRAGFVVALPIMLLLSAMASDEFKLGLRPILALAAFSAVCYALFIRGLGVPMPTLGTVFGG